MSDIDVKMPKISIVIPAFNAASFLGQTIASVSAQSFDDFEIIVVDDGSTDATAEIARTADSRVRVVQQHNQGIAVARNVGLSKCLGEWIAFLDHDDIWHPHKLKVQTEVLERDSGCGIVYGEFLRWNPLTPPQFLDEPLESRHIVPGLSGFIFPQLIQTNWVLLSTAVVRRSVFDAVGGFDPAMPPADDWDLMLRAAEHFRFVKLAQPLALYRVHPGQTSLKLTPRNMEYEIRCRALARLRALDSVKVDMKGIRLRQFRALFNYGLAQYDAGLYRKACSTFFSSLQHRATSRKAAIYIAASYARSLLQKHT